FSLDRAAAHFGLSSQALRRRFKQASGQTMHEALSSLRMERACGLLRDGDLDLAAITRAIGLNNVSSFVRKFSQEQGMTPGKYREQHRSRQA
ncbi:MAG: AraC family transcriptional regulator, partial [Bacillota bacterium]